MDEGASKSPEQGVDALELAKQSEASINNLLELEDKDDELLLQWEENKANQGNYIRIKLNLIDQFDYTLIRDNFTKMKITIKCDFFSKIPTKYIKLIS